MDVKRAGRVASTAAVVMASACATARPEAVVPPVDAHREALAAEHGTRLGQPSRVLFEWSAQEPEFRGSGTGVARLEPPYKARLDLFLDNGETAAIAALVGDELRIPESMPTELIPPPALLWATLGVFRPGHDAEFLEGRGTEQKLEVDYRLPSNDRVRFWLDNRTVTEAALLADGSVVQRIEISGRDAASAYPTGATYRNLPDFRELRIQLESVEYVDAFPPDIWEPAGP